MGILVRSGPLSDPGVLRLIDEQFVPVALDLGSVGRRSPFVPVGTPNYMPRKLPPEQVDRFANIERQDPLSQGIWMITPEGNVLRSAYHVDPGALLSEMELAVADWKKQSSGEPERLPAPTGAALTDCVPDQTRVTFYGRLIDGSNRPPFRDSLDLGASQWTEILPDGIRSGQVIEVPGELMHAFASRLYPGEMRLAIRPEEIVLADGWMTVEDVAGGLARASFSGRVEIDGVVPFTPRRRELRGQWTGTWEWETDQRRLRSLTMVCDGSWRGEYPRGMPPTDVDVYPGGGFMGQMEMSPPLRLLFLAEFRGEK